MNVLVLYQSRNGHTRAAAQAIAQAVQSQRHFASVRSVAEVRSTDVAQADALFIGTWTQGFILFGVKPAGASLWVPALPSLMNKPVGAYCTYRYNPRGSLNKLSDLLMGQGGRIVAQQAFHRDRLDVGMKPFVQSVLDAASGDRL